MDLSKLQEAVKELEAEAAHCLQLAGELKSVIRRSSNGEARSDAGLLKKPLLKLKTPEGETKSFLILAVDALRASHGPVHVNEIVEKIAAIRPEATRSQVESALVRGMRGGKFKHVIKRTAPGTFAAN